MPKISAGVIDPDVDQGGVSPWSTQGYIGRPGGRSPEETLMLAVLESALWIHIEEPKVRDHGRKAEATRWIFETGEDQRLYSFYNICTTLGIHPDRLRKDLQKRKMGKVQAG